MSSGYKLELADLLLAMKKALQATTALPYLTDCRIYAGPFYIRPWSSHTVYLRPMGSPETVVAEDGAAGVVKRATHTIAVECCMFIADPEDEEAVIGRSDSKVGITTFVSHVAGFLENNLLGLPTAQLEYGIPPTIEFPENSFGVVEVEEETWLQTARGIYRAQTRPFYRSGLWA